MQVPDEDRVWEVVDTQSMFGIEIHLKEELSKKVVRSFRRKGKTRVREKRRWWLTVRRPKFETLVTVISQRVRTSMKGPLDESEKGE